MLDERKYKIFLEMQEHNGVIFNEILFGITQNIHFFASTR